MNKTSQKIKNSYNKKEPCLYLKNILEINYKNKCKNLVKQLLKMNSINKEKQLQKNIFK
ncbi:hypothetical protein [Silvanigrella sp.]|jgi:hypothetical protein|uniref:hypothetical protein n=1 Tax=Silvanigrella sp. TaxID=2024976 RepID=UPI0037CBDF96